MTARSGGLASWPCGKADSSASGFEPHRHTAYWSNGELARAIVGFVPGQDVLHAARILVARAVRPAEIDHHRGRERMAARPQQDLDALLLEEVPGPHHVVDILDLMIDVLDAGALRREERQRMMRRGDAQERRVADPVADARVADAGPERLVARRILGVEADMAEAGDAGVARREIAQARVIGPRHDLDLVAGRIGRGEEGPDAALVAVLARAGMDRPAGGFELGRRPCRDRRDR